MLFPAQAADPVSGMERVRQAVYTAAAGLAPAEFLRRFCVLEDRDDPRLVRPFCPWPEQERLLDGLERNRLNVVLKARQLGISWLCLAYALREMLFHPGYSVIALSRTQTEARELVRRLTVMVTNMPTLVRKKGAWQGPVYTATASEVRLEMGGLCSSFRALASGKDMGRGFTASLILLDEWAFQQHARSIWLSVFPAVNRADGGKLIGVSTMERGSLFEEIFTDESNGFCKHFLSWRADPSRDEAWYAQTRMQLGEMVLQEYPACVEDALRVPGGAFFPELCAAHNARRERGHGERVYVALDYGLDRLACLWIAVFPDGEENVFRELCVSGRIASEAAAEIADNCGEAVYTYLAPPDLWNTDRHTGKSTADIFESCGIALERTSNSRIHGWMDVKEHLACRDRGDGGIPRPTLTVDKDACPELWHCLACIQRDRRHPNDAASEPHELTHAPDALRAFCAGRPAAPRQRRERTDLKKRLYAK